MNNAIRVYRGSSLILLLVKRIIKKKKEKPHPKRATFTGKTKLKFKKRIHVKNTIRKKISINLIIPGNRNKFLVMDENICYTYK